MLGKLKDILRKIIYKNYSSNDDYIAFLTGGVRQ